MATKEKYQELADNIVGLVGGKENISYLTHCVTRLRFNVKDKGLVQADAIAKLPGAMGTQWSGDHRHLRRRNQFLPARGALSRTLTGHPPASGTGPEGPL